jgi:hypothetical protein
MLPASPLIARSPLSVHKKSPQEPHAPEGTTAFGDRVFAIDLTPTVLGAADTRKARVHISTLLLCVFWMGYRENAAAGSTGRSTGSDAGSAVHGR